MKYVEVKDLVKGKKYTTSLTSKSILEFVKHDRYKDPLFKQIKGHFSVDPKDGLVPFTKNGGGFYELENQ